LKSQEGKLVKKLKLKNLLYSKVSITLDS